MTVFDLLHGVQDARGQVETWGLSLKTILWVGLAAFVLYLFTLREILAWFLKINVLRRELGEIKAQLKDIRARMDTRP